MTPTGRRDDVPWLWGDPSWDEDWLQLAAGVYVSARDGGLRPDAAFDLAMFLKDRAKPNPIFDELASASADGTDSKRIAALAREALAAVDYVPDFRIEPRLLAAIEDALRIVEQDLRATGLTGRAHAVLPDDPHVSPTAWLRYQNAAGHTSGISPPEVADADGPELLARVADELQDAVMEYLFAAWPICPQHHLGAHAEVIDNQADWWCSGGTGHVIGPVGRWGR